MRIQDVEDAPNNVLRKPSDVQLSGSVNSNAPITRIPNEILAQIFHHGISFKRDGMMFRSSISLVTRHWRKVGINTPSLWAHIFIESHHPLEFVEMYLDRSKECPLAIHLAYPYGSSSENLHTILPPLTLSAYRWRELTIDHDDNEIDLPLILQSLRDLEAPLLETLSVTAWHSPADDVVKPIFMRGAPRLSSVYMRGISWHGCWPPTDNVTVFHMAFGPFDLQGSDLYAMLEALPSVTSLLLPLPASSLVSRDVTRKLIMISLCRLVIDARGLRADTYLCSLLTEVISAPNLETLVIGGVVTNEDLSYSFQSLAASPLQFPALASIELWRLSLHGMTRSFLQSLPNIKELAFIQCSRDDNALQLLLDEEGGPLLLPRLHTLSFETSSTAEDYVVGLLCDLVTTRARRGIPIQKLRLNSHLHDSMGPECMEWLQERVQLDADRFDTLRW